MKQPWIRFSYVPASKRRKARMWDAHGFKVLYTLSLNAKMVRRELVAYMLTANCLFGKNKLVNQPSFYHLGSGFNIVHLLQNRTKVHCGKICC